MTEKLDKRLVKKYPEIFKDRYADMRQTAMCWGFECGDGWYKVIDGLCKRIMKLTKESGSEIPTATQVKEKFGTLRFYLSPETDEVFDLIMKAEQKSAQTCEICGKIGKLREKNTWLKTLCDNHARSLGYRQIYDL